MPGRDRTLSDVMMVPPILMAGLGSASYKTKGSDNLASCLNHGKGNVVGQIIPVEHNRLTVSETVSVDEPAGGYMEMLEYRRCWTSNCSREQRCHGRLSEGDETRHSDETEGLWNIVLH